MNMRIWSLSWRQSKTQDESLSSSLCLSKFHHLPNLISRPLLNVWFKTMGCIVRVVTTGCAGELQRLVWTLAQRTSDAARCPAWYHLQRASRVWAQAATVRAGTGQVAALARSPDKGDSSALLWWIRQLLGVQFGFMSLLLFDAEQLDRVLDDCAQIRQPHRRSCLATLPSVAVP